MRRLRSPSGSFNEMFFSVWVAISSPKRQRSRFHSSGIREGFGRGSGKVKAVALYSTRADVRAKRMVRTVKRTLERMKAGSCWEKQLHGIERASRYSKLGDGYFPFLLMYGKTGRSLLTEVPTCTEAAAEDKNPKEQNAESKRKMIFLDM